MPQAILLEDIESLGESAGQWSRSRPATCATSSLPRKLAEPATSMHRSSRRSDGREDAEKSRA